MPIKKRRKTKPKFSWVEKYRPLAVSDTILPIKHKRFFNKIIKDGETPNLLLYSTTPGSGKTTIARAICSDLNVNPMYINISNEKGINVLRDHISKHASMKTLSGKPKIVILDEFDGATPALQDALRADIEKYASTCRFIMTCNYISKIIDPLREGRVMEFDFNMTDKKSKDQMKPQIVDRLKGILGAEKIQYDTQVLSDIVDMFYPNIRKMVSLIHKYSKIYDVIDENIFDMAKIDSDLYDLILKPDFTKARQFILDNNYNFDELYTHFYNHLVPLMDKANRPQAILIIAQYQYESAFAINKEISLMACIIELMQDCLG